MAYVSIPKDLTQIKTKFLMGLTKRQTICFTAAAVTGLPLFFLLRTTTSTSVAAFVMVVVMLPWFMFAMYERNGQTLEKYLMCIYNVHFKRAKVRAYQTYNLLGVGCALEPTTTNPNTAQMRQSQQDKGVHNNVAGKNQGNISTKKQTQSKQCRG